MKRLSRSTVIEQIERIVKLPVLGLGKYQWDTNGVHCDLHRHTYNGELYSYDIEVLRILYKSGARIRWDLYLIAEFWRDRAGETIRITKWLKLLTGKPSDVTKWLVENRGIQNQTFHDPQSAIE